MTQKEKELSFIDISGRLHYGVMVNYKEYEYDHREWKVTSLHTLSYSKSGTLIDTDYDGWISYEEYKGCGVSTGSRPFRFGEVLPYLRTMSSMTEKEKEDFYQNVLDMDIEDIRYENNGKLPLPYNQKDKFIWFEDIYLDNAFAVIDWLNAHHFDYRNLIEKGLAIEVTEVNNPYK